MTNDFEDSRATSAFRATAGSVADGPDVDLVEVRQRVRRRRHHQWAAASLAVTLALGVGIGVAQYGGDGPPQIAQPAPAGTTKAVDPPPADPAPKDWRTEYYRNVSIQVPATWGYAYEPDSAWCATYRDGKPRGAITRPYVSLGTPAVVPTIGCQAIPKSLTTEHVVVREPGPAEDFARQWSFRSGRWWIVGRVIGTVVVSATSEDRQRAERIIASAVEKPRGAPCPPRHVVGFDASARPAPFDLGQVRGVRRVVICQYDPDEPGDQSEGTVEHGLRAKAEVTGAPAEKLIAELRAAPRNRAAACEPAPDQWRPDLTLRLLIEGDDGTHELYVIGAGCPSGTGPSPHGIDDGTTVRTLTRTACRALLVPPVSMEAGSGDVGQNCLG